MKNKKMFVALAIIIATIIFLFSSQDSVSSGQLSGSLGQGLNIEPSLNDRGAVVYLILGVPLRKWAHIGIFATLGFCCYGWLRNIGYAFIVSYLYACSDEIHQLFVAGRSGRFSDTIVDGIGIIIGIAGFLILEILWKKIKSKKNI